MAKPVAGGQVRIDGLQSRPELNGTVGVVRPSAEWSANGTLCPFIQNDSSLENALSRTCAFFLCVVCCMHCMCSVRACAHSVMHCCTAGSPPRTDQLLDTPSMIMATRLTPLTNAWPALDQLSMASTEPSVFQTTSKRNCTVAVHDPHAHPGMACC
jgi:hypothetical protein